VGDAVCALNPIYAQGLTLAALSALTLLDCLAQTHGELAGLAHRFQRQLARVNQTSWRMATSSDYSMLPPQEQPKAWQIRLFNGYLKGITASLPFSAFTSKTFIAVANLAKPPIALLHPAIVSTVLIRNGYQLGGKYLSSSRRQILNERKSL
jgi:2-polyprenyl-6-methoxyphenol hydroxylase-like FAD-dependent oxidoreductase